MLCRERFYCWFYVHSSNNRVSSAHTIQRRIVTARSQQPTNYTKSRYAQRDRRETK